MDTSKSSGPYSVPDTILKTIRDYISEPLAFLGNDSLASGNFPEKLKLARLLLFLRKTQDLTKTIIDQFLYFPTLVNCLKKLELSCR